MLTEAVSADNSALYPLNHGSQSFMWPILSMTEYMSLFIKKHGRKLNLSWGVEGRHFIIGRILDF